MIVQPSEYIKKHCIILFFFLTTPQGLWDLSSLTTDQICAPCRGIT